MTIPAAKVLSVFLSDVDTARYGVDLREQSGLESGTICPILQKLQAAGWGVVAALVAWLVILDAAVIVDFLPNVGEGQDPIPSVTGIPLAGGRPGLRRCGSPVA